MPGGKTTGLPVCQQPTESTLTRIVASWFELIRTAYLVNHLNYQNSILHVAESSIEWTDVTWNPTTGCTKISAGCKSCYAEVMTRRLRAMGQEKYEAGFSVVKTHSTELHLPGTWRRPRRVFVDSMSDLFHDEVPLAFIQQVFAVMNANPRHTFQVLTKRAARLLACSSSLTWTPNIWMGVSVEDERVVNRVDALRQTGAAVKFLSCEPLIGPLTRLDLTGIHWVIAGGESGHRPRSVDECWVNSLQQQCQAVNVAFFFKQWGGTNKKKSGRLLNGRTYDELPSQPAALTDE